MKNPVFPGEVLDGPLRKLRMGMRPAEVDQILPDTPCKESTTYHGHPALTWGYKVTRLREERHIEGVVCDRADYWIYFENSRLIGWTPLP